MPEMLVVAGPPGSGKSTLLRPDSDIAYYNADERARELNSGRGRGISPEIRSVVNKELEVFIRDHIAFSRSFSYETTLRTSITYEQANLARTNGFRTTMEYVALSTPEETIRRVRARAEQGGHSAPPERIREIYEASLKNLPRALVEFDHVSVYDNSGIIDSDPKLLMETIRGRTMYLEKDIPEWLSRTLVGSKHEING